MSISNFVSFSYAGLKSEDFGVINGQIDGSVMLEDIFLPQRTILEEQVKNNPKPYFMGTTLQPLEFDMTIIFEESFSQHDLRSVARWLFNHDYYQELYFGDDVLMDQPERIFYALIEGDSKLYRNAIGQGYITVHVRCNSPYAYSPVINSKIYDQVNSDSNINYNINNLSNGIFSGTKMNGNNVQLNLNNLKWSDIPSDLTWVDLIDWMKGE